MPVLTFRYWNGTADESKSTTAELCHDSNNLVISWNCKDDQIYSPYQKCNDPLYEYDAVEIFVATEETYPIRYFEF